MKTRDIIRRAGRSLSQAKARTLLTSLAIAVGAFTVSLALAAGAGGRAYIDQMINTSGDVKSLSVHKPMEESEEASQGLAEYGVVPEDQSEESVADALTKKDIVNLRALDGVASVTPQYTVETQYTVTPAGKKLLAPVEVKSDKTELIYAAGTLDNFTVQQGQIVMPESYLEQFGIRDAAAAIGQKITLHAIRNNLDGQVEQMDKTLTVAAVDRESDTTLYYLPSLKIAPVDGEALYTFTNAYSPNKDTYYGATVEVKSGYDTGEVKTSIDHKGYYVFALQDSREALMQMVNIVQWGMAGFGFLAILASIFGIINTQYISVLERTQQIGLMKALGMSRGTVGKLFLYEAAWVGFLGGLIGVIGATLVSLANPMIAEFLQMEKGMKLLIVEPLTALLLIASLMAIAVMSGYFPSRKASKLDPIEALRTE